MSHTIPTLKRDSTRNLCDQFTNIFYDDVNPTLASSIDIALSLSISLAVNASKSSSSSSPLDPPSAAEYPSPAPSSQYSDDSLLLDSLSPPSSPWFPSLPSSTDAASKDHTQTSDNNAAAPADEEVDFFRNPFYRSLHGQDHQGTGSVHPQSLFVQPIKRVSLPLAVKSAQLRSNSGQVSQTAAPSDLFNVSLDQILSAEPLNLSMETQQLLLSAIEGAFTSSQEEEGGDKQQQGNLSQGESDMMEDTLTSGSLSAPESDEDDEFEAMARAEHGQPESDCGDRSDPDYRESTLVKQKKNRSVAVTKKTPRGGTSTTGKAPRARKGTYKRSLKVYPQRRPKSLIKQEELDENDVEIKNELAKDQGILLPGGFKLPLDKDGYLCEFCPKERFGRVHDLKRHQISKHNERTWPCDFCHRPFVRRDALLRHYAVKTARKDGVHPTAEDVDRLSEARARARLI